MNREEYLKKTILSKFESLKDFSATIDMPYTTLLNILKNGIGGAAIDNAQKICKGIDITIDSLEYIDVPKDEFHINDHEKKVIIAYRNSNLKEAVDSILFRIDNKKEN